MLRFVVLGLLHDGRARHGYALAKVYRERTGSTPGGGSFYRDLKRLAAEGLVTPEVSDASGDARRAPYRITDAGRRAFREWLATVTPPSSAPPDDEFALRLVCLPDMEPREAKWVLASLRDEVVRCAATLERERTTVRTAAALQRGLPLEIREVMLSRRLRWLRDELALLDEIRARYDAWIEQPDGRGDDVPAVPARLVAGAF